MGPKLKLKLRPGWRPVQIPNAPVTCVRGHDSDPNVLQVSVGRRKEETATNLSAEGLLRIGENSTAKVSGRIETSRASGTCEFGSFGTITVKGTVPAYMQVWVVANERDIILITHICKSQPHEREVKEANEIALAVCCS
jgi:hypothetical protein